MFICFWFGIRYILKNDKIQQAIQFPYHKKFVIIQKDIYKKEQIVL